MNIGIITDRMPPYQCGIGDYSQNLADSLRKQNHNIFILAGCGDFGKNIKIFDTDWNARSLEKIYLKLVDLELDHLIIQFTPLMYANENNHRGHDLLTFWNLCATKWDTSIIVHETYFRTWWYPKSWINGLREKWLLKEMVEASHHVFSASQPLVEEMKEWRNDSNVHLLPIGSNFPLANQNKANTRVELGVANNELLLTLFGGGMTLKWMCHHVNATDSFLKENGINARWLLLGGVPEKWFQLSRPAIVSGWLSVEQISANLQASDIFLMPHYAGLCAKRGTLIAALQHSLPVIGTRTKMTDHYWNDVAGVRLYPRTSRKRFCEEVLRLSRDNKLRKQLGSINRNWFERNYRWSTIAKKWLEVVE